MKRILCLFLSAFFCQAATANNVQVIATADGDPANPLSVPWAVAADTCGGVYITGINSDLVLYRDNLGQTGVVIDSTGDGQTEMRTPEGIETDTNCNAVIGARGSSSVFRVSPQGNIEKLLDSSGDGTNAFSITGGVATAADGNVYASGIASNNVFRIEPDGTVSQIIDATGDGSTPLAGATSVEAASDGNVYVAGVDSNNVFRIAPDGTVTLMLDGSGDGTATMDNPVDVASDDSGNIYVTARNSNKVFKVSADLKVSVMMNESGDGTHPLLKPVVIKYDNNHIYVSGHASSNVLRMSTVTRATTQLLGPEGDGTTAYTGPVGVTVAPGGIVYTAGINSNNVFRIDAGGAVTMIQAGSRLKDPNAVAIDTAGNTYIANFFDNTVTRIAVDGTESTLIGPGGDGTHPLTLPIGIATDWQGNVFVAGLFSENVFRIHPNGVIHQIIDSAGDSTTPLLMPAALTADGSGNVYVVDKENVFRIRPSGHIARIFGTSEPGGPSLEAPSAVAVDKKENVYVAGAASNNVIRIGPDGQATEIIDATGDGSAALAVPAALTVTTEGAVIVAGSASNNVFRVNPAGVVQKIADAAGDGTNMLARPSALASDSRGDVFVSSAGNRSVFKIARNGTISRIADGTGDNVVALRAPGGLAAKDGRVVIAAGLSNCVFASAPNIGVDLEAGQSYFVASPPPLLSMGLLNPSSTPYMANLNLAMRTPAGNIVSLVSGVPINLPGLADVTFPLALPFQNSFTPGAYAIIASTVNPNDGTTLDLDTVTFEFVTPATIGPVFSEVTALAGLNYSQQPPNETPDCLQPLVPEMPGPGFDCMQESMAGAAAAGDFDNDGYTDLYVTRIYESDLLFRNNGDGTFSDVTDAAGLGGVRQTNGAAWLDIDNDGDSDLYVNSQGETRNYLFVNQGNGTFSEEAVSRGADVDTGLPHWGMSITVGDIDNDGWTDIYTTDWVASFMMPAGTMSHARLLRNAGNGNFVDVTSSSNVLIDGWPAMPWYMQISGALAFSAALTDLDDDGWQDLAITGEMGSSRLFWNNGDGTFLEGTDAAGLATSASEMGSTFGDLDADGDLDWIVTAISCEPPYTRENLDCSGNRVYYNEGNRTFSDRTDAAGLRVGHWGWGAAMFDYDNDSDLDVVMTNGQEIRGPAPNEDNYNYDPMRFFRNDGQKFVSRENLVGLTDTEDGKGLLTLDFDRDGDLDVFLMNTGGPARLYRNDGGNARDYLRISVEGTISNRDGLGARISVQATPESKIQVRQYGTRTHYQGQSELPEHFGLGAGSDPVHRVTVDWPASGIQQVFEDVPRNTELHVVESATRRQVSATE